MATYIAKVKSLSITVSGGSAITVKGVRSITINDDPGMIKEYDADDEVPFFYQGQRSRTVEITMRDYDVAIAMQTAKCVSTISAELAAPIPACSSGGSLTSAVSFSATNLAVTSVVPVNADASGTPTEYSITLELGHNDAGVAGTWSLTKSGSGGS